MKSKDRKLGMDRNISRRDVLHGVGAVAAASFIPGKAFAEEMRAIEDAGVYPPALTGMRGNHPGSFDIAHQLAREGKTDWGAAAEPDAGAYDLIVVGGGISGLAAAHFFRKEQPDARILILDNHDDFGGHAKRNEFDVDGKTLIGYGGSQTLENPDQYNPPSKTLLKDLGVDLTKFEVAYDYEFFDRHGLRAATFFDKENWGVDHLADCDLGSLRNYVPLAEANGSISEAIASLPMSDAAKLQMRRLLLTTEDRLKDIPQDEKTEYLYSISYQEFLTKHMGVTEPEVFAAFKRLATDASLGIDHATAGSSLFYVALPGRAAIGIPDPGRQPYIHHFPDGNAGVARLMVRAMIPASAPGSTMEDIVTARFDYSRLDEESSAVRLRLNSTAVHVANLDGANADKQVKVTYIKDGQAFDVYGKNCVLACYNAIIPSLCPELPAAQREALAWQVKTPMIYTTVALRNWRAWKKLGIGGVSAPSGYHANAMLDFPVSLGDYNYSASPDEPVAVHMERFFYRADSGLGTKEQFRLGRHDLYATTFETIERNVRLQLNGMLARGGFNAADDIASITVNRWAHGYAYGYNGIDDPWYEDRDDERYPHVQARKQHGRIAIANSDAGAGAIIHQAIGQAHRAVEELLQQ